MTLTRLLIQSRSETTKLNTPKMVSGFIATTHEHTCRHSEMDFRLGAFYASEASQGPGGFGSHSDLSCT